jgi:hypothetical protein
MRTVLDGKGGEPLAAFARHIASQPGEIQPRHSQHRGSQPRDRQHRDSKHGEKE